MDDEEFNEQILKEVLDACKKGGIERFESPQRVKVVIEPWTPESGLVTDALKLKRKAIEQKFKDDIEDLYQEKKTKKNTEKKTKLKSNQNQSNDEKKSSQKDLNKENKSNENPTDVSEDVIANDKKDQ